MGIRSALGLDQPGGNWLGIAWVMVLVALTFVVVYGFYQLVQFASTEVVEDTSLIQPMITTALGALVGLLVGGAAASGTRSGASGGGGTSG